VKIHNDAARLSSSLLGHVTLIHFPLHGDQEIGKRGQFTTGNRNKGGGE